MQTAAKLRKQEQEAKKQVAEAEKERRKRRQRSQPAVEAKEDDGDLPPPIDVDEEQEEEDEEEIDMLPDAVIEAVADDEFQDKRILERRLISEQLRLQRRPKQRKVFSERQVGPVIVKVLQKSTNRKASGMNLPLPI